MTTATRQRASSFTLPSGAKRFGYLLALLINGAMLFVANNLLAWGWFSWLTADFEELLPIINVSLVASMLVNAVYMVYDAQWFKSLTQIGVTGIAIGSVRRSQCAKATGRIVTGPSSMRSSARECGERH